MIIFDNEIYEQIDGVSMGVPLAPVLENIIMVELESTTKVIWYLENTVEFYCRYVNDTLLLIKPDDIQSVLYLFNSFYKNLCFTVDRFEIEEPHFLDIKMLAQGLTIYWKNTNTRQYVHYDSITSWNYKISWIRQYVHYGSFSPCNHKISWIRSLVTRAKCICSENLLPKDINEIRNLLLGMDSKRKV